MLFRSDFHCLLPTKPKVVNFKVLKLSGHLVDLSAAQLHPNIMNATGTNPERRAEKPQHHHSALVPSEYAVGCVSLPRYQIIRNFTRLKLTCVNKHPLIKIPEKF